VYVYSAVSTVVSRISFGAATATSRVVSATIIGTVTIRNSPTDTAPWRRFSQNVHSTSMHTGSELGLVDEELVCPTAVKVGTTMLTARASKIING
jgi:hypothetical protein